MATNTDTPPSEVIPNAPAAADASGAPVGPVANPATIAMTALTTFQNPLIQNGKDGVVMAGDLFVAPDLDYAREARRLRLAEPTNPEQLGTDITSEGPYGSPVSIANLSRPNAPVPETALTPKRKTGAIASLIALFLLLFAVPARAQMFGDFSVTVTTTPVQIYPAATSRSHIRLMNVGKVTAGTIWCSRYSTTPAPNQPNSFPLAPFGNSAGLPSAEEFNLPGYLPKKAPYCRTDSGTAPLTADAE